MASLTCLPFSDRLFGPRVDPSCRGFDFTLFFEDVFFACLPAAVFFLLLPFRVTVLAKAPILCSVGLKLQLGKLVGQTSLDSQRPTTDTCIGDFGWHSCSTSGSSGFEVTEH